VRTVYFTINEYEEEGESGDRVAHMVLGGDYRAVPPPATLDQDEEFSPDQELDRLIHQAERRNQQLEFERAQSSLHQTHRQQADVSEDEMSDDLGFTAIQDEGEVKASKDREAYLDLYLRLEKNVSSFEYRDAYHERWNEFFPGHSLFTESDRDNPRRWKEKAFDGLPKAHSGCTFQYYFPST